jgi:hypothetical protein
MVKVYFFPLHQHCAANNFIFFKRGKTFGFSYFLTIFFPSREFEDCESYHLISSKINDSR